jgi:hypothetical protein
MVAACRTPGPHTPYPGMMQMRVASSLLHKCTAPASQDPDLLAPFWLYCTKLSAPPASLTCSLQSIAYRGEYSVHPLCPASLGSQVIAALIGLCLQETARARTGQFLQLAVSSARRKKLFISRCTSPVFNDWSLSLTLNHLWSLEIPIPHIPAER